MAGEMIMPNTTTTTNPSTSNNTTVAPTSNIVELKNMLTEQDLQSTEDYNEILEDTKEECSQFGSLKSVIIPRDGVGKCKIFLEYITQEDAGKAIQALAGRTFDGKAVIANCFSRDKFDAKDYS
jgi:hypothetical protein